MERDALTELKKWKENRSRKPLILHGARQVGKTWLLKEFGSKYFRNTVYINFEANRGIHRLFSEDLSVKNLLIGLRVESGGSIDPEKTLVIFDEVQECSRAMTALKYFAEEAPEYHIAAAGSLLGLAMHQGTSFPVGKVEFMDLHPLSFPEFLRAVGDNELASLLASGDWSLIELFRDKLTGYLKQYFCVGGMPEAVRTMAETGDLNRVRDIQLRLLTSYEQDFSKYARPEIVPRIRAVWNSLPTQLAREQKKFVYGLVREGARAREYETAIEWLCDAGLLKKIHMVSKPGIPLNAYRELNHFKLFLHDVGLLAALSGIPVKIMLEGNTLFTEYKGALTEQYVSQVLSLEKGMDIAYWTNIGSRSEIDFILQLRNSVYPLEVKAAENLMAKSLKVYHEKYSSLQSFRTSLSGYRQQGWLTNIPLYALCRLSRITAS